MDVATRAFCASDYLLFFLSGCRNCLDLHSFPTRRSSDLIIGAHEPQDALVVHRPALAPQQRIEATVAVVAVGDREALEHITQLDLFTPGSHAPPVPIVARAADASQRAHPLDGEGALRGRHRVDEREDALPPRPPFGRGGALTCRKAALKKSSSTACWPTLRSSSTRRESRASLPACRYLRACGLGSCSSARRRAD